MNGHHARGLLFSLLLIALAPLGCETFLGVPLEDQEYKAPNLKLFTPLPVVSENDTIRYEIIATGGNDYFFDEKQVWSPAERLLDQGWLTASFRPPSPVTNFGATLTSTCEIAIGRAMDDMQTRRLFYTVKVYTDLREPYHAAIEDAAVAEEWEVVDSLWAINEDSPYLVRGWGELYNSVQLVTWTQSDIFDFRRGDTITTDWGVTWVTIPLQLIRAFEWERMTEDEISRRLAQYLGLPPDTEKDRMVLLNVSPDDLMRPSMDPEIDDTVAQRNTWSAAADSAYRVWFEANEDYSSTGYPWTRLGYTYDWGDPEHHVGASEYIIREGALVEVSMIFNTVGFFREYLYYYGWWYGEPGDRID
ncbi:hypothetical protein KQI63_04220 [bacterium]|nr:hypothetical protein [bacterium]